MSQTVAAVVPAKLSSQLGYIGVAPAYQKSCGRRTLALKGPDSN
jgi:hypothetical protein